MGFWRGRDRKGELPMNAAIEYLKMWVDIADEEAKVMDTHFNHLRKFAVAKAAGLFPTGEEEFATEAETFETMALADSLVRFLNVHSMLFSATRRALLACASYPYREIEDRILAAVDFAARVREVISDTKPDTPQSESLSELSFMIAYRADVLRKKAETTFIGKRLTPEQRQKSREEMEAGIGISVEDLLAEAQ